VVRPIDVKTTNIEGGGLLPPAVERAPGYGLRLAYREWSGRPGREALVLLHGITGSSRDWNGLVPHLLPRRVIAFDARGHGESDWDAGASYVADSHFADVATALDALGVERFAVAGFSMGGAVATMLAAAFPERVSALVVVDSYPDPRMTPGSRRIAGWVSSFSASNRTFDPAIADQFRQQLAEERDGRLDLWAMWETVQCPTLIVRGALSDVLPAEMAQEMVRRQPLARLVTLDSVAHPIPFARPKELAKAVEAFLAPTARLVE
jgi:pimeloyl-ACP methyl ester carboxylesterase